MVNFPFSYHSIPEFPFSFVPRFKIFAGQRRRVKHFPEWGNGKGERKREGKQKPEGI